MDIFYFELQAGGAVPGIHVNGVGGLLFSSDTKLARREDDETPGIIIKGELGKHLAKRPMEIFVNNCVHATITSSRATTFAA